MARITCLTHLSLRTKIENLEKQVFAFQRIINRVYQVLNAERSKNASLMAEIELYQTSETDWENANIVLSNENRRLRIKIEGLGLDNDDLTDRNDLISRTLWNLSHPRINTPFSSDSARGSSP
jgi:hypothetical protein